MVQNKNYKVPFLMWTLISIKHESRFIYIYNWCSVSYSFVWDKNRVKEKIRAHCWHIQQGPY